MFIVVGKEETIMEDVTREQQVEAQMLKKGLEMVLQTLEHGPLRELLQRIRLQTGKDANLVVHINFSNGPSAHSRTHDTAFLRFKREFDDILLDSRGMATYKEWSFRYLDFQRTRKDFQAVPIMIEGSTLQIPETATVAVGGGKSYEWSEEDQNALRDWLKDQMK